MAFYNQEQAGPMDYRCGAFCLAYLQWLWAGRNPAAAPANTAADEEEIASIYNQVAFRDGDDVIGFSNPLLIKNYLTDTLHLQNCAMYRGAGNNIQTAIDEFTATVEEPTLAAVANHVTAFYHQNQSEFTAADIPELTSGDSAIAIFAGNGALHYMLFNKNDAGVIRLYDPKNGNASVVEAITPNNTYNNMCFTGAGIYIIHRDRNHMSILTEQVQCDYYEFIKGNDEVLRGYAGDYMCHYEWAETTNAYLDMKYRKWTESAKEEYL